MFKPLAIRPGIQCQMTKHCQFLSQANAYNFFYRFQKLKYFVQKYRILARKNTGYCLQFLSFSKTQILLFKSTGFWHVTNFVTFQHETCDFNAIEHPINLSFAVFSALKRAVGLARDKNSITFNLGPVTKLTRQIMGFSTESQKEVVKFSAAISEGIRGCHKSWDSVLGSRWDVLPAQKENGHDTLIKYLRITEHREFTSFNLRCNVQTCTGHYASEEDYRTLFSHNLEQSKLHYFY